MEELSEQQKKELLSMFPKSIDKDAFELAQTMCFTYMASFPEDYTFRVKVFNKIKDNGNRKAPALDAYKLHMQSVMGVQMRYGDNSVYIES